MHCPSCGDDLVISDRQGIEIDYCKSCRGVWLDRGELDKIIERSTGGFSDPKRRSDDDRYRELRDERNVERGHYAKPKKRENFLSELFDF